MEVCREAVLGLTVGVVVLLMALKGFFVNEEWRQRLFWECMLSIERQQGFRLGPVTEMHGRIRKSWLSWTRFPWSRRRRILSEEFDQGAEADGQLRDARGPFGWEFLHSSAWVAILLWIALCWGCWWDWLWWVGLCLLVGLVLFSVILGQFFPINGVRLLEGSRLEHLLQLGWGKLREKTQRSHKTSA
jgi:hypothetical protein